MKKYIIYGVGAVLIVIATWFFLFKNGNGKEQTLVVHPADFIQQVSVSGKVISADNLNLSFEQAGRIAKVSVVVGDKVVKGQMLVSQDVGSLEAQLLQAQAGVDVALAKLSKTVEGASPTDVAVSRTGLENAKSSLYSVFRDSYVKADDAIRNEADVLFTNPNSVLPKIVLLTDSTTKQDSINASRYNISKKLDAWKAMTARSVTTEELNGVADDLDYIKSFIDTLNYEVTRLYTQNSGFTQAQIDSYISAVNSAAAGISTASTNFSNAMQALRLSQAELDATTATARSSDINISQAELRQAQAGVQNIISSLNQKRIYAPIDGIVTVVNAKIGNIMSSSDTAVSLIGADIFQIESYVPEINISFIHVGDLADVTLDAYGEKVIFPAEVISVDPAETIRDGVSTYRVKLQFRNDDERLKSGMTANVLITTLKKTNVIAVPQGIVSYNKGEAFISVKKGKMISEQKVETGSVSSLGNIEIVSGLSDGDTVILKQGSN